MNKINQKLQKILENQVKVYRKYEKKIIKMIEIWVKTRQKLDKNEKN